MRNQDDQRLAWAAIALAAAIVASVAAGVALDVLRPPGAHSATLALTVLAPSTNQGAEGCRKPGSAETFAPGTALSDLKEIVLYVRCFSTPGVDSMVVPAAGKEGQWIPVDVPVVDGSMGVVSTRARDLSGNMSCVGGEYVYAAPLPPSAPPPPPTGDGAGLRGEYFTYDRWNDFKAKLGERVDPQVAFDWGAGSAWPAGPADWYSIRWTGFVSVPVAGDWTFYVNSNDGARLWIDGALVQNYWLDRSAETANTLTLSAGQHSVRLEYYEGYSSARCTMSWSGPGTPKQAIPVGAFSP